MTRARIMIVEDEFIVADGLRVDLEEMGYEVSAIVSSGEEAIQQAEQDKPDAVLMDIVLRGEIDGIDAADKIRTGLAIPVIFLTAHSGQNALERAKVTEPFGYLLKPYDIKELRSTIEMTLYKATMERRFRRVAEERERLIDQLQEALAQVKKLSGLLPICSSCKRIRDDKGYWNQIEAYIRNHSDADFSHSICPECGNRLYPGHYRRSRSEIDRRRYSFDEHISRGMIENDRRSGLERRGHIERRSGVERRSDRP
jgi:CheY-like chemotaxis protein